MKNRTFIPAQPEFFVLCFMGPKHPIGRHPVIAWGIEAYNDDSVGVYPITPFGEEGMRTGTVILYPNGTVQDDKLGWFDSEAEWLDAKERQGEDTCDIGQWRAADESECHFSGGEAHCGRYRPSWCAELEDFGGARLAGNRGVMDVRRTNN